MLNKSGISSYEATKDDGENVNQFGDIVSKREKISGEAATFRRDTT